MTIHNSPLYRQIAARTSEAYSADRYGQAEWAACSMLLLERGYDERETEAILRSKWMRWAADGRQGDRPQAGDLARFLDEPKNRCTAKAVAELVKATFA